MKIRLLLASMCVAGLAFNASAYYAVSSSLETRGKNPDTWPFSYQQAGGATNIISTDDLGSKTVARSFTFASAKQTLAYLLKDEDGNIIQNPSDNFTKTGTTSKVGGTALGETTWNQDAALDIWTHTVTIASGTIVVRRNFATNYRPIGRDLSAMVAKVLTKHVDPNEASRIKVKCAITPSQFTIYGDKAEAKQCHWAFLDFPDPANSGEIQTLTSVGDIYNEPEALFAQRVKYVDFIFENVKQGDVISLAGFEAILGHEEEPEWLFRIPSFMPSNDAANGNRYTIQAEDFDEPWVNGYVAHSYNFGTTPAGDFRRYPEDKTVAVVNHHGCFMNLGATYPDRNPNDVGRFYRDPQPGVLDNMHVYENWGEYKGKYKDDVSNVVTEKDAMRNFGAWFEYTFDAEEDMDLDITMRTACNFGSYEIIMQNGAVNYGLPRSEGGFVVEGCENEDYLKKYGHSLRIWIDHCPIRTNWESYPVYEPGMTAQQYAAVISDPTKWTNTQETDEDGNIANSYVLHLFPHPKKMTDWELYEKRNMAKDCFTSTEVAVDAPSLLDANTYVPQTSYIRPDFRDITIAKGRHTIRVQSMGGQWQFDDMAFEARPKTWTTPTSIENVSGDEKFVDADAPVEYYNLQGVKVVNPQGGIFIRKQGTKVSKVVVR